MNVFYSYTYKAKSGSYIEYNYLIFNESGKRDSNPRHPAWEASTLPTELLPPVIDFGSKDITFFENRMNFFPFFSPLP